MTFEWDLDKAAANSTKHGVLFADAIAVFGDPNALTSPDDHVDEMRFRVLGMDAIARLLVVVYTGRDDRIRIISARKATRSEAESYARDL